VLQQDATASGQPCFCSSCHTIFLQHASSVGAAGSFLPVAVQLQHCM
jgi:hypothetical protein